MDVKTKINLFFMPSEQVNVINLNYRYLLVTIMWVNIYLVQALLIWGIVYLFM